MKRIKKILSMFFIIVCSVCIFEKVHATTITAANSVEKGKSITITVTVPNVNTVDLTANVSGAGTNGSIRIVDGALTGEAKTYSKSITVTPTSAGTITVSVTSGSNAVLNGEYVNVAASKTITVTEPPSQPVQQPTTPPVNTETPTNKPTNTTTNNNTINNNKNTNANTKSSNANLRNMILSVEGLSPAFAKNITNYSLNVGQNINEIKVTASVEHSRASYSVKGNTNLKEGENIITVRVVAEDGTVKNYTINVVKSDDPVKSDATLSSLIIEDVDLGKTFDPNVTEYNAGDVTVKSNKLNIYAYTSSEGAKLEVIGNEDLKVGENKITIKVTSENGKIVKEYVVLFNKLYSEEETMIIEENPSKAHENRVTLGDRLGIFYNNNIKPNLTVLILYLFIWIEFIQVVYLYNRLKKYEDVNKITVGKRIKNEKITEKKIKEDKEKTRRKKENPVFPEQE